MKRNVGTIDKVVRVLLVVVIAALYFAHVISGMAAIILGAVGAILLLTSLISFCPIYWPLGLSTAGKAK